MTEGPDESRAIRSTSRLFAGQVAAVTAIAVVLTAVGVLVKGEDTTQTRSAEPAATTSAAPEPTSGTTSEPPGSTSPTSPAPTTPASTSAPESPTEPVGTPAEERPQVDVVNQSSPAGSAEETADAIETLGWRIGRVDNFTGNVQATTVYYFPGDRKHARALEADLPGRQRVLEAFDTLVEGRLTIVLVEPIH